MAKIAYLHVDKSRDSDASKRGFGTNSKDKDVVDLAAVHARGGIGGAVLTTSVFKPHSVLPRLVLNA